jgi:hypothetical protein
MLSNVAKHRSFSVFISLGFLSLGSGLTQQVRHVVRFR